MLKIGTLLPISYLFVIMYRSNWQNITVPVISVIFLSFIRTITVSSVMAYMDIEKVGLIAKDIEKDKLISIELDEIEDMINELMVYDINGIVLDIKKLDTCNSWKEINEKLLMEKAKIKRAGRYVINNDGHILFIKDDFSNEVKSLTILGQEFSHF